MIKFTDRIEITISLVWYLSKLIRILDLDSNYPIKLFQRSYLQRNNNSARFDRIEKGLNKTYDIINQLTNQF